MFITILQTDDSALRYDIL